MSFVLTLQRRGLFHVRAIPIQGRMFWAAGALGPVFSTPRHHGRMLELAGGGGVALLLPVGMLPAAHDRAEGTLRGLFVVNDAGLVELRVPHMERADAPPQPAWMELLTRRSTSGADPAPACAAPAEGPASPAGGPGDRRE